MALEALHGVKIAGMANTRLRGLGCDSPRRGVFGIGGRAFSSTDGMFATVSTSLASWNWSLRRHQGVVGFLDFTWHLAVDLAEVGAAVEKANDRPQIWHAPRQRATSTSSSTPTSPPTLYLWRCLAKTCPNRKSAACECHLVGPDWPV